MFWIIFTGFLLAFFGWLLFAPVFIYINSQEKKYMAGLTGLLNLSVLSDPEYIFHFRIRIAFVKFRFYPLKQKDKHKASQALKEKQKKKKRKIPGGRTMWLIAKVFRNIIKSSRLKKLYVNVDTDDVMANACLIPLFAGINRDNINLTVNYNGNIELIMNVENNIFHMLVVALTTYLHYKNII